MRPKSEMGGVSTNRSASRRLRLFVASAVVSFAALATMACPAAASTYGLSFLATGGSIAWSGDNFTATVGISEIDGATESELPLVYTRLGMSLEVKGTFNGSTLVSKSAGGVEIERDYSFVNGSFTLSVSGTTLASGILDPFTIKATRTGSSDALLKKSGVSLSMSSDFGSATLSHDLTAFFGVDPSIDGFLDILVNRSPTYQKPLPSGRPESLWTGTPLYTMANAATTVPIPSAAWLLAPSLFGLIAFRKRIHR